MRPCSSLHREMRTCWPAASPFAMLWAGQPARRPTWTSCCAARPATAASSRPSSTPSTSVSSTNVPCACCATVACDCTPPVRRQLTLLGFEAALEEAVGRPKRSLELALQMVARRPEDFTLHELCALSLIQLGRPSEARDYARRALKGAPRHPELLATLGKAERLAGDPATALEHLMASAIARPDLPEARAELAVCFTQ